MAESTAKKTPKAKPDWEAINRDYRAGVLSVREVAAAHGLSSHSYILKRAKQDPENWKRDLSQRVQAAMTRKLVTSVVTAAEKEADIVEEASNVLIAVVRDHRVTIKKARVIESELYEDLQALNKKTGWTKAKAQPSVGVRATTYHTLISAQEKRIRLERQAFGIKDDARTDDEPITGIFIEPISAGGTHG